MREYIFGARCLSNKKRDGQVGQFRQKVTHFTLNSIELICTSGELLLIRVNRKALQF